MGGGIVVGGSLGSFLSEWVSGVLFYAGWWLVSSYLSAGFMKLALPRVRLLILSLSTFALLYVMTAFASFWRRGFRMDKMPRRRPMGSE